MTLTYSEETNRKRRKIEALLSAIPEMEQKIGYSFQDRNLLVQAFVRSSSSLVLDCLGLTNEVLEFIGDKVLDLVIVRFLAERYIRLNDNMSLDYADLISDFAKSCLSEGELTETKIKLVEGARLAKAMDALGFQQYLIVGGSDENNHALEQAHVKEDLFEAILGAAALDCGWDLTVLRRVVDRMLDPKALLDAYAIDEVDHFANWENVAKSMKRESNKPLFMVTEENEIWKCVLKDIPSPSEKGDGNFLICDYATGILNKVPIKGNFEIEVLNENGNPLSVKNTDCWSYDSSKTDLEGYGGSEQEAKQRAAIAFEKYRSRYEEIRKTVFANNQEITEDTAINRIQELWQKGLIDEPTYSFQQDDRTNETGTPAWVCDIDLTSPYVQVIVMGAPSKIAAKKRVALIALRSILKKLKDQENDYPEKS